MINRQIILKQNKRKPQKKLKLSEKSIEKIVPRKLVIEKYKEVYYNRDKCINLASRYNGVFLSSTIIDDNSKYIFRCHNDHHFKECPSVIEKREYFCPLCYIYQPPKDSITEEILTYVFKLIFNREPKRAFTQPYRSMYVIDHEKLGYYLIDKRYYNQIEIKFIDVEKPYTGYKFYKFDKETLISDIIEDVINLCLPLHFKFVDSFNVSLYQKFGIVNPRAFIKELFMIHLYKDYEFRYYKTIYYCKELGLGWSVKHSRYKNRNAEFIKFTEPITNDLVSIKIVIIPSDIKFSYIIEYVVEVLTKLNLLPFKNIPKNKIIETLKEKMK